MIEPVNLQHYHSSSLVGNRVDVVSYGDCDAEMTLGEDESSEQQNVQKPRQSTHCQSAA